MSLVLASGSPRRRQLLEWAGFAPQVLTAPIDESVREGELPEHYVERLALEKGEAAVAAHGLEDHVVLTADTTVHLDGQILGKPADAEEAFAMLSRLANRSHRVSTGVCVWAQGRPVVWVDSTTVVFRRLTPGEIRAYVATGDPLDKAGAYGIQGRAGVFVSQVHGSWTNVMGLPMASTVEVLGDHGIRPAEVVDV